MTRSRPGRAARLFLPSIADLLFVGLLLTKVSPTLFHDGDTGWHLWAGTATLEHGLAPIPDTLSFTRQGAPFENVEWLGEVILVLLYRHAGYLGLGLLAGVVFAGTFAWLYRILLRESEDPVASLLVTVLTAQVTLLQFLARPLIFSFPLFLGAVELARGPGKRALVLLPVLTALWANVHPSATMAPAIAAFFWLRRPGRNTLGLATLLSFLALGITPWGYGWVLGMVADNRAYFSQVEEWAPPRFNEFRLVPYLFGILLAVAARRGSAALPASTWLWGLGWLGAALVSARLGPYAFLAWAPFFARDLAQGALIGLVPPLRRVWMGLRDGLSAMELSLHPRLWPVLAGVGALLFAGSLAPVYPEAAKGFPEQRFPKAALAEAVRLAPGPRVFCNYGWGGYVGWEGRDRWRVFIDGRAGFFGPQLLQDYLTTYTASPGWEEVLDRHAPDWLLVSPDAPIVAAATRSGRWNLVYEDKTAAMLLPGPRP